jgi:hypothetical protein
MAGACSASAPADRKQMSDIANYRNSNKIKHKWARTAENLLLYIRTAAIWQQRPPLLLSLTITLSYGDA